MFSVPVTDNLKVLLTLSTFITVLAHAMKFVAIDNASIRVIIIIITIKTSLPKVIWEEGCVAALSHTYAVKSPLVTMVCPKFAPKVPFPVERSPNRTICLIPRPVWPMMPNGIRSAVFPQCTGQTDWPTHVRTDQQTDRSSTGKFDVYRPNNNNNGDLQPVPTSHIQKCTVWYKQFNRYVLC